MSQDEDDFFYRLLVTDLYFKGLVEGPNLLAGSKTAEQLAEGFCTDMGREFLRFISEADELS